MTQQYFANKVGLSSPFISEIENGKVELNLSIIQKLAKVLEIKIEVLINNDKQTIK